MANLLPSNLQNLKIVTTTEIRMTNQGIGSRIRADAKNIKIRQALNYNTNFAKNLEQVWAKACEEFFAHGVVDAIIGKTQKDIETTFYGAFQILNEYYAELVKDQLLPWSAVSSASRTQGLQKFGIYTGSLVSSLVADMGNSLAKSSYQTIIGSRKVGVSNAVVHGILAVHLDNQKRYERAASLVAIAQDGTEQQKHMTVDIHDTGENVAGYGWSYLKSIQDRINGNKVQQELQKWVNSFVRESLTNGKGIEVSPGASSTLETLKGEIARLYSQTVTKILIAAQNRRKWSEELRNRLEHLKRDELTKKQAVIARRLQNILARLEKGQDVTPNEVKILARLEQSTTKGISSSENSVIKVPEKTSEQLSTPNVTEKSNAPTTVTEKSNNEKTIQHPVPNINQDRTTNQTTDSTTQNAQRQRYLESRQNAIDSIFARINELKAQAENGGLPYAETAEQANQIAREYQLVRRPDFVDSEVHPYVANEILNALYTLQQKYNIPRIDTVGSYEAEARQRAQWVVDDKELYSSSFISQEIRDQSIQEEYNKIINDIYGNEKGPGIMHWNMLGFEEIGTQSLLAFDSRLFNTNVNLVHTSMGLQNDQNSGWATPSGTRSPIERVVWHETGHYIHDMLGIIEYTRDENNNPIRITTDPLIKNLWDKLSRNPSEMESHVSRYALTNVCEFIAESWAEYMCNPTGARPTSVAVAQRLIAYMENAWPSIDIPDLFPDDAPWFIDD